MIVAFNEGRRPAEPTDLPTTVGELRASGHRERSVRQEIRDNLLAALANGEDVWPGIFGFSDTVLAVRSTPASRLRDHDANYVGGDIGVGGNSVLRALLGPTPRVDPWTTPIPHAYLCSSATPPGGGVHGMSGYYAARTMLRREFGLDAPSLRP